MATALLGTPGSRAARLLHRLAGHPLLILTLVAAIPRLVRLGAAPADLDETWSWYTIHLIRSGRGFWQALSVGLDGPLFVAGDLGVAAVAGGDPPLVGLRLLPAIAGTLAIPLTFALARRLWGGRAAVVVTCLCALSPFLIFYSRHARPYSLLLLCCLLHAWVAEAPALRWRQVWLAATAALVMASHYYGIVFLAGFHGLRFFAHVLARRPGDRRRALKDGVTSLVAAAPFVALLVHGLASLSLPHWSLYPLDLPAVWAEQLLFLGSTVGDAPHSAALLNRVIALLLLVPFATASWRSRQALLDRPLLVLGLVLPLLVVIGGAMVGQHWLFFPRGFIGGTPFLLAGWGLLALELPVRPAARNAYAALILVPFLASSVAVATSYPDHAFYRNRRVMAEIVEQTTRIRDRYDVLLVHHWWLAQYVAFYHPDPDCVRGLGMWRRAEAARDGELTAVLQDLASVPPTARVLVLRNNLIYAYGDRGDAVLEALRARRPQLAVFPCRDEPPVVGESMLCNGMFLFGPEFDRPQQPAGLLR